MTLVAYGAMVPVCERAADALEGEASVEVLDLRSLRPLDEDALLASAAKTGRVVVVQEAPRTARLRRRDRGHPRREGDPRPARAGAARHRLRRAVSVLEDRGSLHAVGRAGRRCRPKAPRVLSARLRIWLERGESGYWLRDAATGDAMKWDDPRVRVVKLAGASYRADALQDEAFAPGRRLALVPEPENEHDPNAVAVWDAERRLQAGYVPAEVAPELHGDEQAVSLWEFRGDDGQPHRPARPPRAGGRLDPGAARREGLVLPRVRAGRDGRARRFRLVPGAERRLVLGSPTSSRSGRKAPAMRSHGPIEVRGARAGQTLVVRIDEVVPRDWGGRGPTARRSRGRATATRWHARRAPRPLGAVPRRDRDAAAGARRALDDPAAALGREHRLQGARRRHDALSPDPGRRRAADGGRRPRRARRRRGVGHRDRVPARAGDAHARRRSTASCARRSRAPPTPGLPSASTRTSTPPPSRRWRRCST